MSLADSFAFGFMSPAFQLRIREQQRQDEKDLYESLSAAGAEPWDDRTTKFKKHLLIDAATWKPTVLFDVPPLLSGADYGLALLKKSKSVVWSPSRRFLHYNHVLPKSYPLQTACGNRHGVVYFSADVVHPVLAEVVTYSNQPRVWMSYTPMEVFTQRAGVHLATGRVVVGGLGLGWFLNAVATKPRVTEVVLVEREQELLDWLVPAITARYPAVLAKTTFVRADVYDYLERDAANHVRTRYLLDVWDSYHDHCSKFFRWKDRLGASLWGWGQVR